MTALVLVLLFLLALLVFGVVGPARVKTDSASAALPPPTAAPATPAP